jgi:hypothetical protein
MNHSKITNGILVDSMVGNYAVVEPSAQVLNLGDYSISK